MPKGREKRDNCLKEMCFIGSLCYQPGMADPSEVEGWAKQERISKKQLKQ